MKMPKTTGIAQPLGSDHALAAAGICLAAGSAAFGIGMTLHGPVADLGKSKEFTVFAQLAPRGIEGRGGPARRDAARRNSAPTPPVDSGDLDTTATASIPSPGRSGAEVPGAAVIPSVTLEAVGADSATVAIEGRTRIVRVGDQVPEAGEILAIVPGDRPSVRASRGLIVPAAE